jgi:SpoVK/Ycf46/Vps4 family AAA+-type ATPase
MRIQDLDFMAQIRDRFLSRQSNQFVLAGNVNDVFRCPWEDGGCEYVSLVEHLRRRFSMNSRLVLCYNIARGIQFSSDEDRTAARRLYLSLFKTGESSLGLQSFDEVVAKSSVYVFPSLVFLRKLCEASSRLPPEHAPSIAVIVEHAESLIPNRPLSEMGDTDRQRLIFFREWLTEPSFISSDHLIVLVSGTASAVHESIRGLPHVVGLTISLPDAAERKRFIRTCASAHPELKLSGSQASFADVSAGMTLADIEQTVRLARFRSGRLRRSDFVQQLNRMLVSRIGEYVELVRPDHSLDDVIGNTALKGELARLTRALASGRADVAPTGILITGPNGVGKTYIALAWAAECQRIVLFLKNLRSSHFGETDQIFEKIRNVLQVLGNVMIIVDEADTVFAAPRHDTHETEQRLFGHVIQMMGDPRNRSRIVWILMTARPDRLAPDLKRSGRCGLHLPVFDPEGDDRREFVERMLADVEPESAGFSPDDRRRLLDMTEAYSPADFRELTAELRTEALVRDADLAMDDVTRVIDDFVPNNIGRERRLQSLQAVMHCSKRSLLPPSIAHLTREEIAEEIERLKTKA